MGEDNILALIQTVPALVVAFFGLKWVGDRYDRALSLIERIVEKTVLSQNGSNGKAVSSHLTAENT